MKETYLSCRRNSPFARHSSKRALKNNCLKSNNKNKISSQTKECLRVWRNFRRKWKSISKQIFVQDNLPSYISEPNSCFTHR